TSVTGGDPGAWVTDALLTQLPQNFPQIKALVWFNWNGGGDSWPIESSPALQAGFRQGIASSYYATNTFSDLLFGPIQPIGGSAAYTSGDGRAWQADTGYSGGATYSIPGAVARTLDPALYQAERYGNFSYNFSVPNGTYRVGLKFAELYWTAAGKRVFNVAIN